MNLSNSVFGNSKAQILLEPSQAAVWYKTDLLR